MGETVIIDTHAHLDDRVFDADRDSVLARAREAGVGIIISVGYDLPSAERAVRLADRYPDIYAAVGVHPHDAIDVTEADYRRLIDLARHPKVVALGEMGLDYYRDLSPRPVQKEVFRRQLAIAQELDLPVIIHDRDAHGDVLAILRTEYQGRAGGVLHCFSGSLEMAEEVMKRGFYISIAGPVTFCNARRLQEVVKHLPLDRLLVETDAPYLSPDPARGKRNEPGFVTHVVNKIAAIKGLSLEQVAAATTANARRLFRLP